MASAMDISQGMDEATLRRSPRRRSPDKSTTFDPAMDGVVPRSKSPSRASSDRTSRPRSPIRKSAKKPTSGISRLGGALQDEGENTFLSNNPSEAISADPLNSKARRWPWHDIESKSDLRDPPKSADWVPPAASFGQPYTHTGGLGLFGQPSSPISHWPPHTSPTQSQSTSQNVGFFGQPITSRSPPLSFSKSPFHSRTLFGHPNNAPFTRGLFGIPSPKSPRKLVLPSFIDPLDEEIGSWNPEYQVSPPSPPPGILNMPYKGNGEEELPDALDPRYDSDWEDRLFDPVPGAGIYLGELRDLDKRPKNQNVVYASLGLDGEVEVTARPFNRTGKRVALKKEGEVEFYEIEFRACFGGRWVSAGEMENVERCAKGRLDRKRELDYKKEKRFGDDVRRFWRNREFGAAEVQ
jgi:hypothetical protein